MPRNRLSALAVAFLLAAAPAAAQNLLTNGTFDRSLSGWEHANPGSPYGSVAWSPADADGSTSSGSAQITYTGPDRSGDAIDQCVPVTAGITYGSTGKVFIPSGQGTLYGAWISVIWFSNTTCDFSGDITSDYGKSVETLDSWVPVSDIFYAPGGAQSAMILPGIHKLNGGTLGATISDRWDDLSFGPLASACTADSTHLCLDGDRFEVSVQWTDYNTGVTHDGYVVPYSDETGFFYFFSKEDIELTVKVHDACPSFGHYWVFLSGSTNVGLTLTVTDTKTNQTKQYTNPPKVLLQPITDFSTFGCP